MWKIVPFCSTIILLFLIWLSVVSKPGQYVDVDYNSPFPKIENEKYWACIKDNTEIEIVEKGSNKKRVIPLAYFSDQFALGTNYIYVLECTEHVSLWKAKIHRYSLQGEHIDEWQFDKVKNIYCTNGKLFLQYRESKEDNYAMNIQNGMVAQAYLEEKEFGKNVKEMKADKNGICKVGKNVFYLHSKGFFSTKKEYEGELGSGLTDIWWTILESEDRDEQELERVKKYFDYDGEGNYTVREFQEGTHIFGVLILWDSEKFVQVAPWSIPVKKIEKSYTYEIDLEKGKLNILECFDEQCAVVTTEDFAVYFDGTNLVKRNYKTKGEEILGTYDSSVNIYLQDKYICIQEEITYEQPESPACQYINWR